MRGARTWKKSTLKSPRQHGVKELSVQNTRNWYEERAAPLNGVLPNDKIKEFKTTTGMDFTGPRASIQRQTPRMINDRNVNQALQQAATFDYTRGFRSVLPVPEPLPDPTMLSTQHRVFINHYTQPLPKMSTKGLSGEIYRRSAEPQKDTHAQRSWMYSTDPMIFLAMQERKADHVHATLQLKNTETKHNYGRQMTSITGIRRHHTGVFVDDAPGV